MRLKVRVLPLGRDLNLKAHTNLREALIEAGIPFESPCGGQGTCLKCKVQISGISNRITELEREKLSAKELHDGWRLACQVTVEMPGEVHLPEVEPLRAKASLTLLGEEMPLCPNVYHRHFELDKPTIGDQRADWDRLAEHLQISEPAPPKADLTLLQEIPDKLREGDFKGEVILVGNKVVDLEPTGSTEDMLGVALDIGTTTIAAGLVDLGTGRIIALDAEMNPQINFGADVVSRILFTRRSPEKRKLLHEGLIKGLNRLLLRMCRMSGKKRERIFEATLVGNTTMLHFLLGLDAVHIALSPYVGVLNQALCIPAKEIGLQIHPRGKLYILPSIASFVGADTVAVILATKLYKATEPNLAVDIGTNGEVMLATGNNILAASTAAGPAFEGSRIKFGMCAAKGAISSFQATPSVDYTVIGNSPPRGISGSGLIDLVAELFRVGILDRTGRMLLPSQAVSSLPTELAQRLRVRDGERGFIVVKDGGKEIVITQPDVRELQLAKGAIRAGIELLMKEAGVNISDVQQILLSGVFGNYINRQKALTLGLFPPFPVDRIHFVGNAAMGGALRALLNLEERQQAEEIATQVSYVELAGRIDFDETFMRCLQLGVK